MRSARPAACLTACALLAAPCAALAAVAVPTAPPSIDLQMDAANVALIDVQYCARRTKDAAWVAASDALTDRYSATDDRASGLFGRDIDQPPLEGWTKPLCAEPAFSRWTAVVGETLDRIEATLGPLELGLNHGLWLGAFAVCADVVTGVRSGYATHAGRFVEIALEPQAADAFAAYNRKFDPKSTTVKISGKWVPAWFRTDTMLVRLDGKVVRATVSKPVAGWGTGLKLYGGRYTAAIEAAAQAPCDPFVPAV